MGTLRSILKTATRPFRSELANLGLLSPRVGIAVIVFNGAKVLLGRRQNTTLGSGCWQCTGGHLEFGETIEMCAHRETEEETGLRLRKLRVIAVTNNLFPLETAHYITIWMKADVLDIESYPLRQGLEKKCGFWSFFDLSQLPEPLFEPCGVMTSENLLKLRQGKPICEL